MFQFVLDGIFNDLYIAQGTFQARLQAWGARDFVTDYAQTRQYVSALTEFRTWLQSKGGLTAAGGLVAPDNSPSNSPGRGGNDNDGGGNAGGAAVRDAP